MNNVQLVSPNTVLGSTDTHVMDILGSHIQLKQPKHVRMVLGTQVNGKPHFGTYMVHAITFQLARHIQDTFGLPVSVHIGFLDNTTNDVVLSPDNILYQRNINQVQSLETISKGICRNYGALHQALAHHSGIPYRLELYSHQQKRKSFRLLLTKSLHYRQQLSVLFNGRQGEVILRIPCPQCGYFEKTLTNTRVVKLTDKYAVITSRCFEHGEYTATLGDEQECDYIDLNVLHRNLIKEMEYLQEKEALSIIVKGSDWYPGSQLVDHAVLYVDPHGGVPVRIFTPTIVSITGCKLSKSLIQQNRELFNGIPDWLTDATTLPSFCKEYIEFLVWLSDLFISDTRHFFRNYSSLEILRLFDEFSLQD
jgi:hypothetical protein